MAQNGKRAGFLARRRWVVWAGGAIVAVVLLASFASRDDSVPVTSATVSRSTIRSVISTNGKIEPVQNFEAHAPVGTNVERVRVKEGDQVKKGQLLVELDAAGARSQAAQALAQVRASEADIKAVGRGGTQEEVLTLQARLVKARADYDAAQRNLDSLTRLQQSGAASLGEVRAAQNQLDTAAAEVKLLESKQKGRYSSPEIARVEAQQSEAQSAYSAAQDVLRQLVIRAPFDGIVYSLPVKQGTYVNPGDLVLQEADLSKVLVRAFVDTRNVGETTCIVANQDFKLLPNINVGVTVVTAQHENALTVPREALRQDDSVPYVYQIVNNVLQRRNVQISISNLTQAEITGGVPEHAMVALGSTNSKPLHDGLSVRVTH